MAKIGRPRSEIDYDELAAVWDGEHSCEELVEMFGVSYVTLRARATEAGLGRKRYKCLRGARKETLRKLKIIRKHLKTGKRGAQAAAARELGITPCAINLLKQKYIDVEDKPVRTVPRKKVRPK
jgi:hypothetical protein